jgi:putative DNA primase/helicase
MRTDNQDVMRLAHGRWPHILMHFGVSEKAVSMKHGPCPICEGKDRFRLIDAANGGRWICNQCGHGDGMDLLMAILHCDFKSAAEKLRPLVYDFPISPPNKGPSTADKKRNLMNNIEMWKLAGTNSVGGEILTTYLKSRGLTEDEIRGADLRVHVDLPYYDDEGTFKKNMSCMLGRISSRDGKLAAIHRTYLHEDGEGYKVKKKITPSSREWSGGAIRLFSTKDTDTLIVAEGIETALSARALAYRKSKILIPCWAAVSANNLEKLAIPEHIKHVIIAGDNDRTFTGQKAAAILANRLVVHDKRGAVVRTPLIPDTDFNDVLMEKADG